MMFILVLLVWCSAEYALPHEDVSALRQEQRLAPYHLYHALDKKIENIKYAEGTSNCSNRSRLLGWYHMLPYGAWQILLIVLIWCAALYLYRFRVQHFVWYKAVLWVGLILLSITAVIRYGNEYYAQRAIVILKNSPLHVGPSAEYPCGYRLNYLDEIHIHEERDDWYRVSSNNKGGWIAAQNVVVLLPIER